MFFVVGLRRWLKWFATIPAQIKLKKAKNSQEGSFRKLAAGFAGIYEKIKAADISRFITPSWSEFNTMVEKSLLPTPSAGFLNNPVILVTMFATAGGKWMAEQLKYLESRHGTGELADLLAEDYAGKPLLLCGKYATSHNTIHHAYAISRFFEKTHATPGEIKSVVEWGGGYGNMAKLFYRYIKSPLTYVIIDTPLFSAIQWLYLSAVLGEEKVNLIADEKTQVKQGVINILPLGLAEKINPQADLFVSTWALSESTQASQDFVTQREFFGAKRVLFAHQVSDASFSAAERIGKIIDPSGANTEEITFMPRNYYIFK